MKKKKDTIVSPGKDELRKQLKKKSSSLKKLKRSLKIEALLEGVRERTMTMQKSEELHEVVKVVLDKLNELEIGSDGRITIAIVTFIEDKKDLNFWIASPEFRKTVNTFVPYNKHPILSDLWKARKKGVNYFSKIYGFKQTSSWWKWALVNTNNKNLPDDRKELLLKTKSYAHAIAFAKHSGIYIHLDLKKLPTEQESEILIRFAKVFDQAFIRFLDLQKAEAQSRESQIEAALERVRSRTMSMSKSDELREVVFEFFKQMNPLGFAHWGCIIALADEAKGGFNEWLSPPTDRVMPECYHVPKLDHPVFEKIWAAYIDQVPYLTIEMKGEEKHRWDRLFFEKTDFNKMPPSVKDSILEASKVAFSMVPMRHGIITAVDTDPIPEDMLKILGRFAKVFEQTYTRFLDLQKAEAQARESQVQLALERVRARTMAMRRSDELAETATVLFEQFNSLGTEPERIAIEIVNEKENVFEIWATQHGGLQLNQLIKLSLDEPHVMKKMFEAWKTQTKSITIDLAGYELEKYFGFLKKAQLPVNREIFGTRRVQQVATFSKGILTMITPEPSESEAITLLERFATVFDGTYTRFLDLQKAEAQAREAQIETALERVRSKAMAMQKSEELASAVAIVFDQLDKMNLGVLRCGIAIIDEENRTGNLWTTVKSGEESVVQISGNEPIDIHPLLLGTFNAWLAQEDFSYELEGKDLISYYQAVATTNFSLPESQSIVKETGKLKQYYYAPIFQLGNLYAFRETPFPEEAKKVMKRFAGVFDLTYKRFLDLKKAEAQARESQIQLALERVRARTMAMQKSDELSETVFILFQQFKELGENPDQATIGIVNEQEWVIEYWVTMYGNQTKHVYKFTIDEPNVTNRIYRAWKEQKKSLVIELAGKELFDFATFRESMGGAAYNEKEKKRVINVAFFSKGLINVQSHESRSAESIQLLERFAQVFEQTYTRFLDLKNAEAQVREAQIEAALERVRSRSMAMQKSEELKEVIQAVYEQFVHLNIHVEHTGFIMDYKERNDMHIWLADKQEVPAEVTIPYFDSPYWNSFNQAKEKGIDFFANLLNFDEKNKFYHDLFQLIPGVPDETQNYYLSCPALAGSTVLLDNVGLYIENFSGTPYTAEENNTLMRFGRVFQQTYTRFLDLQKAEAQALEAIKRASVDRIRAEIASMRTTDDLKRITPLIWNELTTLGVPFVRCGVFIMDEEQQRVETHLSTPDGKAIASFTSTFSDSDIITEAIPYWRRKEMYKTHWDETKFLEQAKSLVEQGAITSGEKYLTEDRPTDLYLHFLPFLQGMLYAGSTTPLNNDELQLVQNLANAFSTAYSRYEDFNRLEAANIKIEKTLVDLKQTQSQLVQSEKMASLGELTAGIAHEIQNPLNFVNNFSEVNTELIDELSEQAGRGNVDEVQAIAKDIKENEKKINHHGKRADAIVKGMLQHSRLTSGEKKPTDINALADEYLRLAYHGLRAKDNAFHAAMKTNYDHSIGKLNVIPQDLGRVLLNLYNNAFYAVAEKAKKDPGNYEPDVSVGTKKINDKVEISVKDNGNGVPQRIIDKIFQPFFTTKPTGQGTGLGLSLSYDIVKAHGGEIKVETKEAEGSEFIIQLPINYS